MQKSIFISSDSTDHMKKKTPVILVPPLRSWRIQETGPSHKKMNHKTKYVLEHLVTLCFVPFWPVTNTFPQSTRKNKRLETRVSAAFKLFGNDCSKQSSQVLMWFFCWRNQTPAHFLTVQKSNTVSRAVTIKLLITSGAAVEGASRSCWNPCP